MHVSDVQKKGEKRRKRAQYGCRSLSVGMTEQCRQQTTFTLTPTLRADGELCERSPIREQPKLQYGEGGGDTVSSRRDSLFMTASAVHAYNNNNKAKSYACVSRP